MLKIGEFSKLSRVSVRMLRHYEQLGLLIPKQVDESTGYRYYAAAQLTMAGQISFLKSMGFSLGEIKEVLSHTGDPGRLSAFLEQRRMQVQAQQQALAAQLTQLNHAIKQFGKDDSFMKYSVTLKTQPARHMATLRMHIPQYDQEGILWELLNRELAPLNPQFPNPCYSLVRYLDEEHMEQNPHLEIQIAVLGSYPDTEHLRFVDAPEQQVASILFKGPYEQICDVNRTAAQWVADNGYRMDGPMFCVYIVSPGDDQNPEHWITEACFPIVKA